MVEWVLFGCLILVLIVSIAIAWIHPNYNSFNHSAWYTFFIVLTPMSLFLSVVLWFSTLQMQQRDEMNRDRDSLDLVQNKILRIDKVLVESAAVCPAFVTSLTQEEGTSVDPETLQVKLQISYISDNIFSAVEMYVREREACSIPPARFHLWFKSQTLRMEWDKRRSSYPQSVQKFVESLVKR